MKKNILLILVLILVSSISTSFADSPGIPIIEKKEHIDIGSYDIWLHADGVTWQKNIKPGSSITHNPTIKIPVDDSKNPKNFNVEFLSDPYDIASDYRKYAVNSGNILDFEYLGNGQLSFKLNTKLVSWGNDGRGFDIKEYDWQMAKVQGWRFYIPVRVTWEYEGTEDTLALITYGAGGLTPAPYAYYFTTGKSWGEYDYDVALYLFPGEHLFAELNTQEEMRDYIKNVKPTVVLKAGERIFLEHERVTSATVILERIK